MATTPSPYTVASFWSAPFNGLVRVQEVGSVIYGTYFGFSENSTTSPGWTMELVEVIEIENTKGASYVHSLIHAYVFFQDKMKQIPALAECRITVPTIGKSTVGLVITRLANNEVVYTTGLDTNGTLLEVPVTYGSVSITGTSPVVVA